MAQAAVTKCQQSLSLIHSTNEPKLDCIACQCTYSYNSCQLCKSNFNHQMTRSQHI